MIPGDTDLTGPQVGFQYHLHHPEGPAVDVLQAASEKEGPVLPSHH